MTDQAVPSPATTLGDVEGLLEERGISLTEVKGFRIEPVRRGDRNSPLRLEVKRYLTDDDGRRFLVRWPDSGNQEVAYETVCFPLEHLSLAVGEGLYRDPKVHYEQDGRIVSRRRSQIIVDQRPRR